MGVMSEKELNLEETEASHTLGGAEEGRVHGRGKGIVCICSCAIRLYAFLEFMLSHAPFLLVSTHGLPF